ncbi:MAG: glycosyltransferase family 4 protein [Bacteriovoracia bacterium]
MRWLQWANVDLAKGLGGVEVHARRLAEELRGLGVEASLSHDPRDLSDPRWDVIHTHGSLLPHGRAMWEPAGKKLRARLGQAGPLRIVTLHGSTWERMRACGEYTWPGGYLAYAREVASVSAADLVCCVRERVSLFRWALKIGKRGVVCGNGWDTAPSGMPSRLPPDLGPRLDEHGDFLFFVGRGADPVKGTDVLAEMLRRNTHLRLVAAPGEGFSPSPQILETGRLDPTGVVALLRRARAVIAPSRYEGYSIVVLETLAEGVPIVVTEVGAVTELPKGLQGVFVVKELRADPLAQAVEQAYRLPNDPAARQARAQVNRPLLLSWRNVAERCLSAAEPLVRARGRARL